MKVKDAVNYLERIEDWKKWMDEHHIKIRGDPDENGKDEIGIGGNLRSEMGGVNQRETGCGYFQKYATKRKAEETSAKKE